MRWKTSRSRHERSLKRCFDLRSLSNKLFLKDELHSLKMEERIKMIEHVSTFNRYIANLQMLDKVYKSEHKAVMLLTCLPLSYMHLCTTLMFSKRTMKYEEVMQDILTHHQMVQHFEESYQSEGLVAKTGGQGSSSKREVKLSNSRNSISEDNEGCFECGSEDHWKKNSPVWN